MSIRIEHMSHVYQPGSPFEADALEDIDLTINDGDLLALIGHTGSGKSTLAQHLNGLLTPTSGRVLVDGEDINAKGADRRALRQRVGLLFQYAEYQLFEETVYKDIAFGPKNQGLTGDELDARVREAFAKVHLPADTLEKSPFELSGGQMRRVALAGVVAMQPRVLVMDEPIAGLDPKGRDELTEVIRELHDGGERSVTHCPGHDSVGTVHGPDQVYSLHRGAEAEVAENREAVLLHAGVLMVLHFFLCAAHGLFLRGKRLDHEQASDALLQKDAQPSVRFLHLLVQTLEDPAEEVGQQQKDQSARKKDPVEQGIQGNQHDHRADQPHGHPGHAGQNVHITVCHHDAVVGEAVHPLTGVHGADRGKVLAENAVGDALFEEVLQRRLAQFDHPAQERAEDLLEQNQQDDQQDIPQKCGHVFRHGAVDDAAQQQGIENAGNAGDRLQDDQCGDIPFFSAGNPEEPAKRRVIHVLPAFSSDA